MKTLRVGVLGLRRGMTFAQQFQALPDTQTAALCDRNPHRLDSAKKAIGSDVAGFEDYERMLEHDLDMVVVASPAPDHVAHALMALDAGCHVLSEVPAAVTLDSARQLVRKVQDTGLKYMLAENCCYWGYVREYKRQVESGRLGEVLYGECEYLHDVRSMFFDNPELPAGAPFHVLASHPASTRTWRAGLHPIRYLTHDIGPMLDILHDRCVRVTCMATAPACGEGYAPAAEVAIFRTAQGRVLKFLAEFSMPRPSHHWFVIMGTRGSIESPRGPANKHLLYAEDENMDGWAQMPWTTQILEGPREAWASGHGGADWHISRQFADSILHDKPSPIDVYRAMDFTVPGICAAESAENDAAPVDIPDLRDA